MHPKPLIATTPRTLAGALLLTLAVSLVQSLTTAAAALPPTIPTPATVVRVGVYQNEPLVFVGEDGAIQGIYIDILQEVASQEGWQLAYVTCAFSDCLTLLETGQIDLMTAIAYSEARAGRFDFSSETVLANWGQLYTRPGDPTTSLLDLHGRTIAVVAGDIYYAEFQDTLRRLGVLGAYFEVEDYAAVLRAIETGQAEVGLAARLYGHRFDKQYRVERSPIICCPTELRVAAPQGQNQGLLAAVDRYLAAAKTDPQSAYHRSFHQWLDDNPLPPAPAWLPWIPAILAGLILLFGSGMFILRAQVASKTRALRAEVASRKQAEAAEREHRIFAEALRDTAAALVGTLDFDAILDRILVEVEHVVPHDAANIMLIEMQPTGERIVRVARCRGYDAHGVEEVVKNLTVPLEMMPNLQLMAETGRPLAAADVRDFPGWVKLPATAWIRSYVSTPICTRQSVVGFLNLDSATTGFFSQDQAARLQAFADQAGAAIENANLYRAERISHERAEALRQATQALGASLKLADILQIILAQLKRVLDYDSASVFILDAEGRLDLITGVGYRDPERVERDTRRLLEHSPILQQMARDLRPIASGDVRQLDGWLWGPGAEHVRSWLGAPLMARGQMIGALLVDSAQLDAFGPADLEIAEALTHTAAQAIENARLFEDLQRHALELEERVAERTSELSRREAALQSANAALQDAAEKLRELNRLKTEFVSNVSHELRTPLTNIKLLLNLLEKGKPEKRDQYMATMNRETDLLHTLIEDLLYLSRMDLGKVQPTLEPVAIGQLAGQLAEDRAALLTARRLTLHLDLAPNLPLVLADRKMLMQVVTNLMTNAMNYTPAGGTVTVKTGRQISDFRFSIEDGPSTADHRPSTTDHGPSSIVHRPSRIQWVALSVSDTGPGISADERRRLFERFFRGEAGRKSQVPGTGLGLAICQEIVERHQGIISVDSQVGVGSTFTVWLPAADGGSQQS